MHFQIDEAINRVSSSYYLSFWTQRLILTHWLQSLFSKDFTPFSKKKDFLATQKGLFAFRKLNIAPDALISPLAVIHLIRVRRHTRSAWHARYEGKNSCQNIGRKTSSQLHGYWQSSLLFWHSSSILTASSSLMLQVKPHKQTATLNGNTRIFLFLAEKQSS